MTRKRKTNEGGVGQHDKVPRMMIGEDEDSESLAPWEIRPGMIMEVKMRNFMCHEKFTFTPNQKLTFLSGENGSGKSAVLTAIVFALGGNARVASRGNSNKGFIRTDQTSASVEVRLCNLGENCYKPEKYGESIRIARTVTQSTSTYKIMDDKGRVVVEKKQREELERILMSFDIQVENPIAVLNQDTAKTFLFKCDPEKLYVFFMKATKLETCKQDYNTAAAEKDHTEILMTEKKKSLPALKKERDIWEKKHQFHMNLKQKKKDLDRKKGEIAWASVRDLEVEIEESRDLIKIQTSKVNLANDKIADTDKKLSEFKSKKTKVEKEIQEVAQHQQDDDKKLESLRRDFEIKNKATREVKQSHYQLVLKKESVAKEIKVMDKEVERLRIEGTAEYDRGHQQRLSKIRKLEDQLVQVNAEVKSAENHIQNLSDNSKGSQDKTYELRGRKQTQLGMLTKVESEIERVNRAGSDRLRAYGDQFVTLVNEIQRSNRFRQKPIGPLGLHIKVKDGTPTNVRDALDHELRGIHNCFLVHCNEDRRELFELFSRLRLQRKPPVFTCPFTDRKHNIENNRVYSEQFSVLIDHLLIENANVFNRVVDSCQLERVLYIPSTGEAQKCLSAVERVPRNIVYATVANSYYYYPAPNYRSYHFDQRLTGHLKPSIESYLSELKEKQSEFKSKVKDIDSMLRTAEEEMRKFQKENETHFNKHRALKGKSQELGAQIARLRNEDANEQPPNIAVLEEEVENRKQVVRTIDSSLDAKNEELEKVREVSDAAKQAYDNLRETILSKRDNIDPLNNELIKIENGIKSARSSIEHYNKKRQEYESYAREIDQQVSGLEEKLADRMAKAMHFWKERIDTRKKVDSLKREIIAMEESLRKQEESHESREVVTENFHKYKKSYETAMHLIESMDQTIHCLDEALKHRKTGFKSLLRSTCKNVNINFTTQLSVRNYIGRLDFNHPEKLLCIQVNPNNNENAAGLDVDRDIRNLSGGEKSYSSVSLILALWQSMTPPFRVLDEFDVFMDTLNRKIAIENILTFARLGRKDQFIFLTPLGTDNIDRTQDDVKIIKLSKLPN